jgi:hypothetical protein
MCFLRERCPEKFVLAGFFVSIIVFRDLNEASDEGTKLPSLESSRMYHTN